MKKQHLNFFNGIAFSVFFRSVNLSKLWLYTDFYFAEFLEFSYSLLPFLKIN
jgi:hypothetical protein